MGRRKGSKVYKVNDNDRHLIETMAAVGISHEQIGSVLNISVDTLTKHYKRELAVSRVRANAAVAGALYKNAMSGNVVAQIFWLKTRAGWRETDTLTEGVSIRLVFDEDDSAGAEARKNQFMAGAKTTH